MTPEQLNSLVDFRTPNGKPMLREGMMTGQPATARSTFQFFEAVSRKLNLDEAAIVSLFKAAQPSGKPALADAMERGYADVVIEFGDSLARLDLNATSIAELLNAKQSADSAPALYLACKTGQRSTINAFAKVVDKFKDKLDETQRAQLFDGLHKGESASALARRQGYLGASTALELQRRRHFSSRTIDLAG